LKGRDRLSIVQYKGDPLSDLIRLLRPKTTLWARIDAHGRWGVSFRQRDDLLFCWVETGDCHLLRPGAEPMALRQHDFAFVRTSTPFTLASDPGAEPVGSDEIIAATGLSAMTIGDGTGATPTVLRGGRFVFDTANEALLTTLLPQVVRLNSADPRSSGHLKALLTMNEEESRSQAFGSQLFVGRLMELILLEALRQVTIDMDAQRTGLLAGLADPKIAPALTSIHADPLHPWTVTALAWLCGLSRSSFAHRFGGIMGIGAIEYLQEWRIALAKDALRSSNLTIGEIGLQVGFQSPSAFSTAFTRIVGCSPKRFRDGGGPQMRTPQ
jgi:AraC-like DNA-binding protein